MNSEKIQCNKCSAKFLILGRDKIACTHCRNMILVKELSLQVVELKESKKELIDEIEEDFSEDIEDPEEHLPFPIPNINDEI